MHTVQLDNTYVSFKCRYFLFSTLESQLVFAQFFLGVTWNKFC